MKIIFTALVLVYALSVGASFSPAVAEEKTESPGKQLQLEDQMRGLRAAFASLETHLDKKPPAYDEILKTLDEMVARAKTIESLGLEGHSAKSFKRLFRDIDDFKKSARAKNASGVEDGMNRLAENCFRCHLSHR